jgi:hypothetical protein
MILTYKLNLAHDISKHIITFIDERNICYCCDSYIDIRNKPDRCYLYECKMCPDCAIITKLKCWDTECQHINCIQIEKKRICLCCYDNMTECGNCGKYYDTDDDDEDFFKCGNCNTIFCDECDKGRIWWDDTENDTLRCKKCYRGNTQYTESISLSDSLDENEND